jgi:hypothetical protein
MPELLWVDFCSCVYEVANSVTAGGFYVFHRCYNHQYQIESPLPEPLGEKLAYIFPRCIICYMPFVQDPERFLQNVQHTLLWDERSGDYAVVVKHRGDRPEERMFIWLRLKQNGYVFVSLLSIPETAEESKKWQIIRVPPIQVSPGGAVYRTAGGMFLGQNPNSHKALEAFPSFLAKHKGVFDYLYVNSLGLYQGIVVDPAQQRALLRGEETGLKEMAMGFITGPNDYISIVAKESTGYGWTFVALVKRAGAARLRAKLSGLKRNMGGIQWKQINVPYGAMITIDKGLVFYKVVKLRKPGGDKAGYMFEFKVNRGTAYIRFPYVFRSYKKLIDFVERGNSSKTKKWIRASNE